MSGSWEKKLNTLIQEAEALKADAWNRNDRNFSPWKIKTAQFISEHTPAKKPTFEEIRFASDFFLSKKKEEQNEINDRIALTCDIDLAIEILNLVADILKDKQLKEKISASSEPIKINRVPEEPFSFSGIEFNRTLYIPLIDKLSFNEREKEEIIFELERLEKALQGTNPDWDKAKRTLKFLLDFDRKLAIALIPKILPFFEIS